jgi:hypothetical protein
MYSEYKAKLQVNQSYAIGSVLYSAYVYLDFTHHVGTADVVGALAFVLFVFMMRLTG